MKIAIISTTEVVRSTTAKYRYTIELRHWSTVTFHLCHYDSIDCTPYDTVEQAQAAIHETATLWHWNERKVFLKKYESTELEVLHHRYKVKA